MCRDRLIPRHMLAGNGGRAPNAVAFLMVLESAFPSLLAICCYPEYRKHWSTEGFV